MTIWIATNGRPSDGAAELAKQPGFVRARKGGKIKTTDLVINWGSSQPYGFKNVNNVKILNAPNAVGIVTNKLSFFQFLFGPESQNPYNGIHVKTVDWTDDPKVAQSWADNEFVVFARTKLTGHSGQGIIIVDKKQEVPPAPLYTKYVFKEKEYRVHVVGGKVIDTQQKIRDPNKEPTSWKVRSHENGFIFARNNINPDPDRDALAIAATGAIGLDFGAVDIIRDKAGTYYVLEINTAPGLEGQTIESYANAFRNFEA